MPIKFKLNLMQIRITRRNNHTKQNKSYMNFFFSAHKIPRITKTMLITEANQQSQNNNKPKERFLQQKLLLLL